MGAFVVSGIVFVVTLLWCGLLLGANNASDAPRSGFSVWPQFWTGGAIAALIFASHWMPHIGW